MRVLFDLVHPADALFFANAIRGLTGRGAEVRIASRCKDVLTDLLDDLGLPHEPVSTASAGLLGQAAELVKRDAAMVRLARQWKPDVMAGFGGVAIAHAGALLGIPSLSFYDTEHAGLQLALTLPFISEWHVPQSWTGRVARGRTYRFRGSKQFAYLHPDHFRPDPEIARAAGWDPGVPNFLVRTVAWQANHDHGRKGIAPGQLRSAVEAMSAVGKVHISAEGDLPPDLEPLRVRGSPAALHHLLAHCRLYCGESITVASEATALGVPALLQIDKDYGYIAEQERAGLIVRFGPDDDAGECIRAMLAQSQDEIRHRALAYAREGGDLNRYIVDAIERAARPNAGRTGAAFA